MAGIIRSCNALTKINLQLQRTEIAKYEYFMGCLLKLRSYGLVFTAFDDIVSRWLDEAHAAFSRTGVFNVKCLLNCRKLLFVL